MYICTIYGFDGEFILYYLLKNGYRHIKSEKEKAAKTFTTLISQTGTFFKIEVYLSNSKTSKKKITFYNSLNIIPFRVEDISKAFDLKENKLSIDYNKKRELGHILSKNEENYIINDVVIVAKALKILFNEGLTHLTQSSNAMKDFKSTIGILKFDKYFPQIDIETLQNIKQAYKRWL